MFDFEERMWCNPQIGLSSSWAKIENLAIFLIVGCTRIRVGFLDETFLHETYITKNHKPAIYVLDTRQLRNLQQDKIGTHFPHPVARNFRQNSRQTGKFRLSR